MKIELHIDRLVVDAGCAGPIDRERLAQAVSQALAQRVDAGASRHAVRRDGRGAAPRAPHRRRAAPGAAGRGAWGPAMSGFPGSPRMVKGAIVGIDPFNPLASIISFQYNPDTLTRTLQPQTAGGDEAATAPRHCG